MEIPQWVILVVSFILAPVTAQALKFYAEKFGKELHRKVVTAIVAVISIGLGVAVLYPEFPIMVEDIMEYIGSLLQFAGAIFSMATIIYNLYLGELFERILFAPPFQYLSKYGNEAD